MKINDELHLLLIFESYFFLILLTEFSRIMVNNNGDIVPFDFFLLI